MKILTAWIVLLFWLNSEASAQHTTYIEDTLHYCITEPVAKFLLKEHRQNRIHQQKILQMDIAEDLLLIKISGLENKIRIHQQIDTNRLLIQVLTDEQLGISEKERKQMDRRAKRREGWNTGKMVLIGILSGGAGIGIGVGIGSLQ